jgi:hypothetical protein
VSVPERDEDLAAAFERVAAAVAEGRDDLGELGFWRLVARVKADPELTARWADAAGRIDRTVFERRQRWRVPVAAGNALLLLATLAGALAVGVAFATSSEVLAGLALIGAGVAWSVGLHDLAHWAIGRAVGIRFTWSFLNLRPFPPRPGLKTDYASYLRTAPRARAWMHASGAIATKLAPFVALAFVPAADAPAWAAVALAALGAFEIATDLLFSVRSSDWMRVRRELRFARSWTASR